MKLVKKLLSLFSRKVVEKTDEEKCAEYGHMPMFSKKSELYWFGMQCHCCRCGASIECPE